MGLKLLIAGVVFFVIARIRDTILDQKKCPPKDRLQLFLENRLPPEMAERRDIVNHLGVCGKCQLLVEEFNSEDFSGHLDDY